MMRIRPGPPCGLYEALDDYDDALNVFSNFDVAEEILEQLD